MVSIMDGYILACALDDMPVRGKKLVHINGVVVLLVACESGYYALEDACPHTGRSMAHGKMLDCTITSPHNGARYDLRSGKYVGGGQSPFQSHWLTTFPVKVANDSLYVKLPTR